MPSNYITHEPILRDLEAKFTSKKWNEEDVYRWCQQVEVIYVADPDSMYKYLQIPLEVTKGKLLLPANLYRLLDVYWIRNYDPEKKEMHEITQRVRYNRQDRVLKQLIMNEQRFKEDRVFINYIGTPLDKDCMPLIFEPHWPACETLCKINGFEADALMGKINMNVYMDWKQRFDGMIQGVKGGYRNWDAQEFADMTIVHGNEIPKIGFQPLAHKYTGHGVI